MKYACLFIAIGSTFIWGCYAGSLMNGISIETYRMVTTSIILIFFLARLIYYLKKDVAN